LIKYFNFFNSLYFLVELGNAISKQIFLKELKLSITWVRIRFFNVTNIKIVSDFIF